MKITKDKTIKQLQEEFTKRYPALKIEFYKKEHGDHEGSPRKEQYTADKTLASIQPNLEDGKISLAKVRTVAELEEEFETQFDLHVQVFRQSNDIWLQTISTDDLTLEVQNQKGLQSIR